MSVRQLPLPAVGFHLDATAGRRWGIREGALALLALAYPFHYYAAGPGEIFDLSLGDAVIAVVMIAWCVRLTWGRTSLPPYITPLAALILVAFASLVYPLIVPGPSAAFFSPLVGFAELAKLVAGACWMIAPYFLLRRDPIRGIKIFSVASIVIASIFAVLTIHESLVQKGTRPSGPFENENLYANYLVLNLFLALLLVRLNTESKVSNSAWMAVWVLAPILAVGILATGSRGALIGAVVAVALAVRWRLPRHVSVKQAVIIPLTIILSGYGLLTFWEANTFIADRVSTILTGEGPNIAERAALWEAALRAFWDSPLIGIGYHQFPDYAGREFGLHPKVPHNTYLSFAAELGLLGLIAWFWLLLTPVCDGVRMARASGSEVPRLLMMPIVATLVQGLFADAEHYRSLWIAFGMLAALRGGWVGLAAQRLSGQSTRGNR